MTAIEKKSLKVGRYVDTAHVDTVIREYKQTRWVHNSERIGKEDTLSSWFSIAELEDFLAKSKQHGADGVRLYFGAYPEKFPQMPAFASQQTIVFVATKQKESNGIIFDKDVYLNSENKTSILAYNLGRLCPNICTGGGGRSDDDNTWGDIGITIVDRGDKGSIVI